MLRNILLGVGVFAALFSVLIFSGKIPIGNKAETPQGEVVIWGTIPDVYMNKVTQEFNPKVRTYRVVYKEIREDVFVQTLLEALASGTGPDMILAPHQIILSQTSRIYPFPLASFSEKSFKDMYVDGASIFFTPAGALALPISIEPMVLFYNRTLFSKHGIVNPPSHWDDVSNMVKNLTVINSNNQFVESGISLGAPNTPYAKDILMAIVSQLGQVPVLRKVISDGSYGVDILANAPVKENDEIRPLTTAVRFFTQFADPTKSTYSWNQYSGNADDAFVAEKLAMYIGYSGELDSLRARNQKGEFEMTYLPQTRGYNTFATGARIYGLATLKTTKNPVTSFNVQAQFSGSGVAPSISSATGGVPALRAYATSPGLNDVIARSMLVARGWYDNFPKESTGYTYNMLADILNNKLGITDAVSFFVSRMQDMYTAK